MSIFKFKQFEVDQAGCAMRINTDGVLLAAMATAENPKRILDIGTGTGVIALMLAQRYEDAFVNAVEIDEAAANTAALNFRNSAFKKRLSISNLAIEQFNSSEKFDLIVSNPPFFVNDLKNLEEKKGIARHASEQFFKDLVQKVIELLSVEGCFWFILPVKQAKDLIEDALVKKLYVWSQIEIHSDADKPAFRQIVCLGRTEKVFSVEHFHIYQSEKVYTEAYKILLKDFFLGY